MHGSACVIRDIYVTAHSVFDMPAGTPVRGVCGHVFVICRSLLIYSDLI